MEICRMGPSEVAARRGLFADFLTFNGQVVSRALDTPQRVSKVPRTVIKTLA